MATHDPTLEYLTTTKIGEKGQLTVPKPFREDLRLENGAPFAVLRLGDSLILLPEQQRFEQLCQRVSSSLTAAGLTSGDLLATLPEARNRVYARRYEKKGTSHRPPAPFSKLSRKATGQRRIRLFLDSNVLTGGILSPWGLDKATLSLCAAKVCRLVLAEVVRDEVGENLLLHAERLPALDADQLIEDYRHLIKLTKPEIVPYPDKLVGLNRHLIRHAADVLVLLSAMAGKPDRLLTHNTKHFTNAVAQRTSGRIATPAEFFRALSALFR
jgi:AbrB family looped-hinge helix DNA binding protein